MEKSLAGSKLAPVRIRGPIMPNNSELKTRSKGLSHWLHGDKPYLGLHLDGLGMEKSLAGSKSAPVRIRGPIMPNDSELKTRSKGLSHWLHGDQPYLGLHVEGLGMEKSLACSKLAPVRFTVTWWCEAVLHGFAPGRNRGAVRSCEMTQNLKLGLTGYLIDCMVINPIPDYSLKDWECKIISWTGMLDIRTQQDPKSHDQVGAC